MNSKNWTDFSSVDGSSALTTMNRTLPPWVGLFLAIAIGWQIARIIWMLVPAPAAGDAVEAPVGVQAASQSVGTSADVRAIANNHMFGVADADDAPAVIPEEGDGQPDTTVPLILKGTIASDVPEFSVAVIARNNTDQKVYAIGDAIQSGVSLHRIYPERVVLNESGALTNLRIPSEFPKGQSAPVRRATTTARQSNRNQNSIQNAVAKNLTNLTDVIRPTPYLVNGQQAGYRVYPGRNRQQFAALGLRPGDLIKDIDGQPLNDPTQAMEVFQSLGSAQQVTVTIERQGKPQTIVLKTSQLDLDGEQTQ